MISHTHKFIFIHIPKCGGTSIESILRPYSAVPPTGGEWAKRTKNIRNKGLFDLCKEFPDYFKFAYTRDPIDRFISAWKHFASKKNIDQFIAETEVFIRSRPERFYRLIENDTILENHRMVKEKNLKKLVEKKCWKRRQIRYPFGDRGNIGYHLLPQHYFILSQGQKFDICANDKVKGLNARAFCVNNVEPKDYCSWSKDLTPIDFIADFHDFKNQTEIIMNKINIPCDTIPHKRNRTKETNSVKLTSRQEEKVYHMYEDDYILFSEFLSQDFNND